MTQTVRTTPDGHYRIRHVAKSEALKILTLRSSAIILGITVVAVLAGTALEAHADVHHVPSWYAGFDPTQESLTGLIVAALTGGVFGALAITGEYSSGTIRSTLAAAPRPARTVDRQERRNCGGHGRLL
jgi:ABC-type transport system involved in multi-copper enzyme maturation permease subunit